MSMRYRVRGVCVGGRRMDDDNDDDCHSGGLVDNVDKTNVSV
jgi:hypothetical protein